MAQELKKKKNSVLPAAENKPEAAAEPVAAPAEIVKADAPKEEVSIIPIIESIPQDKAEMAEKLGVPLKPILRWAYVIEETVKAQSKALSELGVKLQPVIELSQKVAESKNQPANRDQGNPLGAIMQFLPQFLGPSNSMSVGDQYFMEMGREMASLGTFMTKEMMKRMMPAAFTEWEKTITKG